MDVFIYQLSSHSASLIKLPTIVPLLKNVPLAQNEFVIKRKGDGVFVCKSNNAPQAECPSICNVSLLARLKNKASVGETMIDSRARTPESPTVLKDH